MRRPVGYLEFRDAASANNAIAMFSGWKGWGPVGLLLKLAQPGSTPQYPVKREREAAGMQGLHLFPRRFQSTGHFKDCLRISVSERELSAGITAANVPPMKVPTSNSQLARTLLARVMRND